MKLFVCCLILCAVGVSQAQYQDSPEVAAAKAAHFEAVRRAELVIANAPAPVRSQTQRVVEETSQHKLGLNVLDTPEVAAAKVAHYEAVRDAEHATATANATGKVPDAKPVHYPVPVHYSAYVPQTTAAPIHYPAPVQYQHSAPVTQTTQHQLGVNVQDTPEVAAAKAVHYASVRLAEQAAATSSSNDDGSYVMVPNYQQPAPMTPVHQGAMYLVETPEVAAAKAAHFEALRRAEMAATPRFVDQYSGQYYPMAHQAMYMPSVYNQNFDYNRMVPVVAVPQTNQHKLGFNVQDTPEVAAVKAAHLAAYRQAQLAASENENMYYMQVAY